MVEISDQEIDRISLEIEQDGLTYTALQNELLDHICCQVEALMEQGMTFNEAYRSVRKEMGKKRIRQIQDETLSLISKKYRRMKRIMYGMGVAAPVLVLAGLTFKVFHWPGAGIILTLALLVIGGVFLPLFAIVRIRDTRSQNEPVPMRLYITGMVAGMLTIIGTLFKIQHWPAAGIMITLGLLILSLGFLPLYAVEKRKEAKRKNEPVNNYALIGGVLAGIFVFLGAMFKVQHWPGAGIVILVSWSLVGVVMLPVLVLNHLKQKDTSIRNFLLILMVAVIVSLLVLARARNVPKEVMTGYYIPEASLTATAEFLGAQNATDALAAIDNAGEDSLRYTRIVDEADRVCEYIQFIKMDIVEQLTGDDDEAIDASGRIHVQKVTAMNDDFISYDFIVERDSTILYDMLVSFREGAMELSRNPVLTSYIGSALSLVSVLDDNENEEMLARTRWAWYTFKGPFVQSYTALSMYEATVRLIERELLDEIRD